MHDKLELADFMHCAVVHLVEALPACDKVPRLETAMRAPRRFTLDLHVRVLKPKHDVMMPRNYSILALLSSLGTRRVKQFKSAMTPSTTTCRNTMVAAIPPAHAA